MAGLLPNKYSKPQCQYSESVKVKAKADIAAYIADSQPRLLPYIHGMLANKFMSDAISELIKAVADTAPDVYNDNEYKIDLIVKTACKNFYDYPDDEFEKLVNNLVWEDDKKQLAVIKATCSHNLKQTIEGCGSLTHVYKRLIQHKGN